MKTVLFLLVVFIAYAIQSITGFGGPLLAMPAGILLVGLSEAKGVLTVLAWITAVMVAVPNRRFINWKAALKIIAVMSLGILLGLWLYDAVPKQTLLLCYGVVVLLVALKNLLVKKELHPPAWVMLLVLLAAGVMQGLFVSGGAFLIIYAMHAFQEKNEFRATSCAVWSVLNLFMMGANLRAGLLSAPMLPLLGASLAVSFLAVYVGGIVQRKLNRNAFLLLTNLLLLASGLSLLLNR